GSQPAPRSPLCRGAAPVRELAAASRPGHAGRRRAGRRRRGLGAGTGRAAAVAAPARLRVPGRGRVDARAGARRRLASRSGWAALAGGVLLGFSLYLSYGLVLVAALAVVVVLLARHPVRLLPAALGAATVVAVFTAAGFWWLDGYHLVVVRYYQGWAAQRPYAYWVWANLACLVLSAGPATAPILRRCVRSWRRPAAALALAATAAILAADLSGLSKAEVERIWLPYAVWLPAGAVLLPTGSRRWWLAAQAATALAVNHLLLTHW